MNLKYDVVVVGAGVAGCLASYKLAKTGFKVALLERKPEDRIGEKVCGDGIGSHHFKNIGLEEPRVGIEATCLFKGIKVYAPNEEDFIIVHGEGYALNRYVFGQKLLKMALDAGVELYDQVYANKPIVKESWVRGVNALEKGSLIEFYAKAIVDASGAIPAIRLKLPEEWWVSEKVRHEDYVICYREILELDNEVDSDYAAVFLSSKIAPGGYWWLFPKGGNVVNVGLGLQWKSGAPNPKRQYDEHIRSRFKVVKVVHGGGGIAPSRRSISCMVWNGFISVGDSVCTTNPIHGGGIGSGMLSAKLAAEALEEALTIGDVSIEKLWSYHKKYMKAYGAKQAVLDVVRIYLQHLEDRDFNFLLSRNLLGGIDLKDIVQWGRLSGKLLTGISLFVKLLSKPSLLAKISILKRYMDKAWKHYLEYPESPKDFEKWREEGNAIFENFKKALNLK